MTSIVIADDHRMVREGLRAILEAQPGFSVVGEAGSGEEAVALVQQLRPQVIVLDIEMPGMNGIVAASEIFGAARETRILALSRHNEKQYVAEMFAAGAAGYILKDSAVEELIRAIETVVNGQMFCSPALINVVVSDYSGKLAGREDSPLQRLTPRELEVLRLMVDGLSLKEIAAGLHISYPTAATHRHQIMKKLALQSDVELVKFAIREGLTTA